MNTFIVGMSAILKTCYHGYLLHVYQHRYKAGVESVKKAFEKYPDGRRPDLSRTKFSEDSPFYFAVNHFRKPISQIWCKNQAMGENLLRSTMVRMTEAANNPGKKTNYSARKGLYIMILLPPQFNSGPGTKTSKA